MTINSLEIRAVLLKRKEAIDTMLVSREINMEVYQFLEQVSRWEFHMYSSDTAGEIKDMNWAQAYYDNASQSLAMARKLVPNKPVGIELIGFMQMKTDELRQRYNLQQVIFGRQDAN